MEINNQKNDQNIIPNDADKQQKGVNVPNLRFDNESWTESKMGNVCSKFDYGIGAEAIDFDGKNRYIRITDIDEENSHYIKKSEVSPSFTDENCIVKENDILFARTGASTGKTYLYNEQDGKLYFAGFLIRANVRNEFSAYFIYQQTKINRYKKWIQIMSARSGQPGINAKEYQEYKVYYPNRQIQDKMASFFTLLDQRIDTQSKIIEKYKSLINTIRTNVFSSFQGKWTKLCDLVENKSLQLNRGNIIPKHPKDDVYKYPVYSSSVQKDGLMGYSDYYMFDKELITWSIDGGGDIFFREKHKFCVTNVCGILQLDTNKFSYRFVAEALKYQHSKMTFDYQTKAHPSVIEKLYSLPDIELNEQNKYSKLFEVLYFKLSNEQKYLEIIKEQKKYLLSNMFI